MRPSPTRSSRPARSGSTARRSASFSFKTVAPDYPYAIWMPQPVFLAALLRKAEPLPSFKCWMGSKVTKLLEEAGRVVGVSGLRHGKEPFEIRADVVVGADGRYSTVARLGGFTPEYEHHDFDIIWFTIEQPPGWSNTLYVSLGEELRGLLLPKYPHHIQAGLVLHSPLLPMVQRRLFFGAPLPPLDPAFSFREPAASPA